MRGFLVVQSSAPLEGGEAVEEVGAAVVLDQEVPRRVQAAQDLTGCSNWTGAMDTCSQGLAAGSLLQQVLPGCPPPASLSLKQCLLVSAWVRSRRIVFPALRAPP